MERVDILFQDVNAEVNACASSVFHRLIDVRCGVVDLSNGNGSELSTEIIVRHEEDTIVLYRVEANPLLLLSADVIPILVSV